MKDEVIEFILRRFRADCHWLNGNCYYFALILHNRFPNSIIYYDPIDGHFITKIGKNYYDWRGIDIQVHEEALIKWDEYEQIDPIHYNRIKNDVLY